MNSQMLIWAWWGWEPLQFYIWNQGRSHESSGSGIDAHRAWYEFIHNEETVKAAAELGINCIVTHFVKGFGLDAEAEEIARCAELTEICHRHQVKVFGYLQYGSIFHESFFIEHPDAVNWIKVDESGKPYLWCGTPGRYLPCINSPEYVAHLKKCIRKGIQEVNLDGLHFDNFYAQPCYCQRCNDAYMKYCGEPQPTAAEINDTPCSAKVRRWVKYRVEALANRMSELRDYAKSLNNNIMTIWNPSPIRGVLDQRLIRAADFCELGKRAGMLWAESGNCPRIADGKLINQVNFFKTAEAVGYQVFSTTWKTGSEGHGLVSTPEEVMLVTAEASVFGAWPGSNFMMRQPNIKDFPNGELCQAFRRAVEFYRTNSDIFVDSSKFGEVVLYFDWDQAEQNFADTYGKFQILQQILLQNHLSYDLAFSGQQKLPEDKLIVSTGDIPECRNKTLKIDPAEITAEVSGSYAAAIALPDNASQIAGNICALLGEREFVISAPQTVIIERRKAKDGRNILHCINYDNLNPVKDIRVTFRNAIQNGKWISPDHKEIPVSGKEISLPELKTWSTLIF